MYQLFSQIIIYVAIVDGGLGSAVLYALYKPNSKNDDTKINQILAGSYKIFSLLGALIFAIAAVLAFFVPFLIKDYSFNYFYNDMYLTTIEITNDDIKKYRNRLQSCGLERAKKLKENIMVDIYI